MGPRTVMCLDMDAFFASVEQAGHPELRGRPVVVGGHLEARGVVASASYEARTYGIHAAMPIRQARRLCPHAAFLPGHYAAYEESSRHVRAILSTLSPRLEMASIDEAFLDLSGTERALGPALRVARELQERIRRELGLPCSIGLAGSKLLAKVACERAKPGGVIEVPHGGEAAFLAPLPVTVIPGIGPRTAARLAELRIATCRDLAAAPLPLLQQILGSAAASLQRRARGIDNTPVEAGSATARSISRATTLARDSRDPTLLRAVLLSLVERVGQALRTAHLGTTCVAVQVRWADFTAQSHQRTLAQATASDAVLYRAAGALLSDLLAGGRQRVRLLGIEVSRLAPLQVQLPLLLPEQAQAQRALRLWHCLDGIRERHGFGAIQRGLALLLRERSGEGNPTIS